MNKMTFVHLIRFLKQYKHFFIQTDVRLRYEQHYLQETFRNIILHNALSINAKSGFIPS